MRPARPGLHGSKERGAPGGKPLEPALGAVVLHSNPPGWELEETNTCPAPGRRWSAGASPGKHFFPSPQLQKAPGERPEEGRGEPLLPGPRRLLFSTRRSPALPRAGGLSSPGRRCVRSP